MLLKWKCSMSFAIYVPLHSGPSNSFFLHLGISLTSSKENSLGNLKRYVGPYDGTIEVRPFFRNFQSSIPQKSRIEVLLWSHQTSLEKHIPSLAFFGYIPAQTRLFRNSHSGFHKGSCHHKTSSAITHMQWSCYNLVNTSSLPHGLHLMLCSNLLLGPTLLPLQRGGCMLSTRLAWQKKQHCSWLRNQGGRNWEGVWKYRFVTYFHLLMGSTVIVANLCTAQWSHRISCGANV